MKRIAALLLTLAILFSVAGCSKKTTCPMCSAKADFSAQVYCSNCGYDFGSMKPDGYQEEQPTPEELAIYELTGVWLWPHPADPCCFSFMDDGSAYWFTYSAGEPVEIIPPTYTIEDNTLVISYENGEQEERAYRVDGNKLFFEGVNDDEYTLIHTYDIGGIAGTWECIFPSHIYNPYYNSSGNIDMIKFYYDNTYQTFLEGQEVRSGYYRCIHDGSSLAFENDADDPYSITMLSPGLMLLSYQDYIHDIRILLAHTEIE